MGVEDLPIGKSAIISAGEDEIALFNYKGKYYAVANKCPHREGIVICPNHEWRFKLENGANMQNPELFIPTYPVKVRNENIYIGLEGEKGNIAYGKTASTLPSSLKFSVPTIQKPRNPDEELD